MEEQTENQRKSWKAMKSREKALVRRRNNKDRKNRSKRKKKTKKEMKIKKMIK